MKIKTPQGVTSMMTKYEFHATFGLYCIYTKVYVSSEVYAFNG